MRVRQLSGLLVLLAVMPATASDGASNAENNYWPQWRGPLGTGVAPNADPPVEWNDSKNIRWKVSLPGTGHATPIIWDDHVFLTTAVPFGEALKPRFSTAPGTHDGVPITHQHKFVVIAVSRRDGRIRWQRTVHEEIPHEGGHYSSSLASNSPVTDGECLLAFFGSHGLYCLDFEGDVQWKHTLGEMQTKHGHGEGSSPLLCRDVVIVNWDHEGQSFVIAFDKRTGEQRWKTERDELTSWATPIAINTGGKTQVIVSGTNRVRGYDVATGEVMWECGGLSANVVASPVAAHGMLFAGSSYDTRALLAVNLDSAHGDITGTDHVVWTRTRGTPYVPSPLLYGDSLYFLAHYQGVLSRVNAKSGEDQPGPFRLGGIRNVYASPVGAANRVYVTDLDGTTAVVSHSASPKILARNRLSDSFAASAAIVGGELFLRGRRYLYSIAAE